MERWLLPARELQVHGSALKANGWVDVEKSFSLYMRFERKLLNVCWICVKTCLCLGNDVNHNRVDVSSCGLDVATLPVACTHNDEQQGDF